MALLPRPNTNMVTQLLYFGVVYHLLGAAFVAWALLVTGENGVKGFAITLLLVASALYLAMLVYLQRTWLREAADV